MEFYKKIFIIFFISILPILLYMPKLTARGIIIADGDTIRPLFRDSSPREIKDFANRLSKEYSRVILHLGSRFAFQRGGLFFYRTSKENLITFSDNLELHQVELELWMLDSFGSEAFMRTYSSYQDIIEDNLEELAELDIEFTSIIVDLEWINLPKDNNGDRFLEILEFLKVLLPGKQVKAFAPIIDNDRENRIRGYDQKKLEKKGIKLIPMLYVVDGGFYKQDNKLQAYLSDNRINQLKTYYKTKSYTPAVSLEGGLIVEKEDRFHFIKTVKQSQARFLDDFKVLHSDESRYFRIDTLLAPNHIEITRNDGEVEKINKGQKLFRIEIANEILRDDNYLWHYGLLD